MTSSALCRAKCILENTNWERVSEIVNFLNHQKNHITEESFKNLGSSQPSKNFFTAQGRCYVVDVAKRCISIISEIGPTLYYQVL